MLGGRHIRHLLETRPYKPHHALFILYVDTVPAVNRGSTYAQNGVSGQEMSFQDGHYFMEEMIWNYRVLEQN